MRAVSWRGFNRFKGMNNVYACVKLLVCNGVDRWTTRHCCRIISTLFCCLLMFAAAPLSALAASIWPVSAVPGVVDVGADQSVELGVKFWADADGLVTGIRFYKAVMNVGPHVGNLWSSNGTRLATITFSAETQSGWQQANLSTPVAVSANTVYVVSYHASGGHYSANLNYFSGATVDAPPLHSPSSGVTSGNGVYVYGSVSAYPSFTYNAANYWVDVVYQSAAGTSPSSIVVSPNPSTIVVGGGQQLKATGMYSNGGSADITSLVTWSSSSPQIAAVSAAGSVFGGSAGVATISANSAGVTGIATVTVGGSTVGNIWPVTAVPGIVDVGPENAVELGVKFRSDIAGYITGIRFYKGSLNTGQHVGSLWSSSGVRLATATFAGETGSGWQEVSFASPVAISANVTYVASYHASVGHYSASLKYFAGAGVDNAPLHALADGVFGGNGVYIYGAGGVFPTKTYNSANYWVDVAFRSSSAGDIVPPYVTQVVSDGGTVGIAAGSKLIVSFSEAMTAGTVNTGTIVLRDSRGALVPTSIIYDSVSKSAVVTPVSTLQPVSNYTLSVLTGIADLAGNHPGTIYQWPFTTMSYGAKGGGPGGPILVITDSANRFSEFYAEVLLTEGLNAFSMRPIADVSSAVLAGYDVVILGEMGLNTSQVSMLSNWVQGGGRLIAMRPDKQLAGLLGLTDAKSTISQGYLLVNTASGPGIGIVDQTIQFHGVADRYGLNGATSLAALYSSATSATGAPAVTLRSVGTNGGQAAAFVFDLAKSIVQTRQGNPGWAGQDRDGNAPTRSNDLFYGAASFDPQPDWVDLNKMAIPQADEQQRLLANMLISMNSDRRILPRFWYFPRGAKAVIVMTGDDHDSGGTAGRFDQYLAMSAAGGNVDNWETIRGTSYLFINGPLTNSQLAAYNSKGFEIGLHLNSRCLDYTQATLETMFTSQLKAFESKYPSLPPTITHRIHCIAWSGYTILPEVEAEFGIRLDTSYYAYPPNWINNRPGVFTGSGMPMRYSAMDGNVIDVYQAATQMTDESEQTYPFTVDSLLDRAQGAEGYYGAFVANMHTDAVASAGSDAIISSARNRGVPVITSRQLLSWLDGRNSSSFGSVQYSNGILSFSISANALARGLQAMVPIPAGKSLINVLQDGVAIQYSVVTVKGINYAVFAAATANYKVNF